MSDSDDVLIDRIRQKDQPALVEFIERRRPQLLAFIERSLSDGLRRKVEPQDIVQDVAMSALHSFDEFDLSQRDPFSWLCQLAERRIIDAHRKYFGAQKRTAEREVGLGSSSTDTNQGGGLINMLVASMTTPSQAFSRNQKEFKLLQAMESLPTESREALRLRYVEGLPTKEIAQLIGKTDGAVRVMLTRSLSKLQGMLSQEEEFK